MNRTPVNPWSWSQKFGYNQAEILEGSTRELVCSGQTSVDSEGNPQHADNMRDQMALCLSNLEAVLNEARMSFSNLTRLNVYTTDVDEAMQHFDVLGAKLGAAGVTPPMTLLGVSRLALPDLKIEIEATAKD